MKRLETIVPKEKSSWKYNILYSCPYVIVLGRTRISDYECVSVLPILNYRFNILLGKNNYRIVHNIPSDFPYKDLLINACRFFTGESKCINDLCDVFLYTYYYGGYIIFIKINNKLHPLNIEVVNSERLAFYFKPSDKTSIPEYSYDFLSLLGVALRLGDVDLVENLCKEPNCTYSSDSILLRTLNGELIITKKKHTKHVEDYYFIVPDNNPVRNVVKVE